MTVSKLFSALILFFALLDSQACHDEGVGNRGYSRKLRNLLTEARQIHRLPIRIEFKQQQEDWRFQGETEFSKSNEAIIRVAQGFPPDHQEQILAHELFHVILFREGFTTSYEFRASLLPTHGHLMNRAIRTLNSCLLDVLIDKRMIKRRFRPEMLAEPKVVLTRADVPDNLRQDDLWLKHVLLQEFCTSLRVGAEPLPARAKYVSELIDPTLEPRLRMLAAQFGDAESARFDTPNEWVQATKHLRSVAGYTGVIYIRNPTTGNLE